MKIKNNDIIPIENDFNRAVSVLAAGGVVAFPTETYYGLGVDPFNESALEKLFSLKGRSTDKAILVLIDNLEQLSLFTEQIPEAYVPLMRKFWPGPLTMIFRAKKHIHPLLTGYSGTVGIRMSPHPVARLLCRKWQKPITATSANLTGMAPADTSAEVIRTFGKEVDYVVNGGITPGGLCSTVINYDNHGLVLVRQGQIDFHKISQLQSATRELSLVETHLLRPAHAPKAEKK